MKICDSNQGGTTMATLYDRVAKGMEVALDKASKSVEALMEKAEDTAEVIKFRLEKTRLEREISKKFAELGSKLYEKAVREGKEAGILQESEVQAIIEDLKRMDRELAHTHALMEQEMEKQTSAT
jgi:Xaa-Pro aminopeptidase